MSNTKVVTTQIESSRRDWTGEHLRTYLASRGTEGHIVDLREIGGLRFTTTLLLSVIGRKSGQARITPLIYGGIGGEIVVVASKGGADVHPQWYQNLKSNAQVSVQVGTQAFRASWREPQGAERARVWNFMEANYPPYKDYQAATQREIPLVMLTALQSIDALTP
jgi:deazaflavin-dependent oxidoreductase (nitroreductase family)